MGLDILIPLLQVVVGIVLSGIGIEMANNPPTSKTSKWMYRSAFVGLAVVLCGLTLWQAVQTSEQQKTSERKRHEAELKSESDIGFVKGQLATISEFVSHPPPNLDPKQIASAVRDMARLLTSTASVNFGAIPDGGCSADQSIPLNGASVRDSPKVGWQLEILKRASFVDLNFDSVTRVVPGTGLTQLEEIWLPRTVQDADVVISMPKIKTHHWAGVTLSLKNSFGILPGSIYGWPKNVLHWQGIDNSIVELAVSVPIHFVVADGIEVMEGNGPLHGRMRRLGCIVFANDPVAADATCCRLMGIHPNRVRHLQMALPLGNLDTNDIEQRGEAIESIAQQFELLPQFAYLRG